MSEISISREEAIKELKEYAENSWGDLSDAFEQAISDMEKLEKIEHELKLWYENAPLRTQEDDIRMLLRMVDLLGVEFE